MPLDRCNGFCNEESQCFKVQVTDVNDPPVATGENLDRCAKKFDSEDCPESADCCATINELEANAEVMFGRRPRRPSCCMVVALRGCTWDGDEGCETSTCDDLDGVDTDVVELGDSGQG